MSNIKVYFATNRDYHNEQGKLVFTNEIRMAGAAEFRVGEADVKFENGEYVVQSYDIYPERRIRSESKSNEVLANPKLPQEAKIGLARHLALKENPSRDAYGSTTIFQEIQNVMDNDGGDALLLVHGFATGFEQALAHAAELKHKFQSKAVSEMMVGVFCWPADGRIFPPVQYFDDRQDAMLSGLSLARLLCRIRDFMLQTVRDGRLCGQKVHLLAHGMGNWTLRFAIQTLVNGYEPGRPMPIFENVFLIAADDDEDTLEKSEKLKPITRMAKSIHVYHSKNDQALCISDINRSTPDRLGTGGLQNISQTSDRVVIMDCCKVDQTNPEDGNHHYYRKRPEVIEDIVQVLSGKAADEISTREMINNDPRHFRIKSF